MLSISPSPLGVKKTISNHPYLWLPISSVCVCHSIMAEREHERKNGRISLLSENRGDACLTWTWTAFKRTCDDKAISLLTLVIHLHSD